MIKTICGIDIGGTTIKIGFFNLEGRLLKKWEIETNKADKGRYILDDIYESILNQCDDMSMIVGYGFGVPGPVIDGKVFHAVNLGWVDFDLKSEFSSLVLNKKIHVDNDANVAALGEALMGAAEKYSSSVMLTLGTGIGGGVIINNRIIDGAHGSAGEIGHMLVVHENGIPCNCGKSGCLETVASATGIKNLYEKYHQETHQKTMLEDFTYPSAKMIFDAAKKGDQLSIKVVDEVTYYLGYACHILSLVTNPEIIVIGGGVSKAGEYLTDKIKEQFLKFKYSPVRNTMIEPAELGNDAGIYGAMGMVKNRD
ncbi:MAG: ROK family glucokinase [Firmicutes bacterium]|nr:ROK family glucokinase [Bacillota bacterium]